MNARIAPAADITERPNSKRCHTKATAVSGSAIGAPREVRGFAKIKPVGDSRRYRSSSCPNPNLSDMTLAAPERQTPNAKRPVFPSPLVGARYLSYSDGREHIQNLLM